MSVDAACQSMPREPAVVHRTVPPLRAQDAVGQVHATAAACGGLTASLRGGGTPRVWGFGWLPWPRACDEPPRKLVDFLVSFSALRLDRVVQDAASYLLT